MRLAATGLLAIGFTCALLARPAPARACKVGPTFVPPSNVELVGRADRIVVGRVVGPRKARIEVDVTRVLKGRGVAVGTRLRLHGHVGRYRGASKPGNLARARPGAFVGSCTAFDYAVGRSYVVFLGRDGAGWNTVGTPFARVNEEAEPIWLKAVEEYVRVGAIRDAQERRAALDALVARGSRAGASAADRAIASDVDRHLGRR